MNNYWKDTIEYINKKHDFKGENFYNWFSPKEVKDEIYGYCFYAPSTIHSYFRVLVMLGYIHRIDTGKYIKIRDIPTILSFSAARNFRHVIGKLPRSC
jgi:hypothetical protein